MNQKDSKPKKPASEHTSEHKDSPIPVTQTKNSNQKTTNNADQRQNPTTLHNVTNYATMLIPETEQLSRRSRFWNWFRRITIAEAGMLALTLAIAVTTIYYAKYARRQWKAMDSQLGAMHDANKLTQQSLNISQRAYVTVGRKDGTVADFIIPKDPAMNVELVVYFQNSGHIPAKLAWGTTPMNFVLGNIKSTGINYIHPFKGMLRTKGTKTESRGESGESTIIAGDSVFAAEFGEIPQDRFAQFYASKATLLMMGNFEYCDSLGDLSTHIINIQYRSAPNNQLSFTLLDDSEIPTLIPPSTPDIEYLPPCGTVTDDKKQEKPN